MRIGIDASRAFIEERTGIEEYSYQVIKHLVEPRQCLGSTRVVLYIRKNQKIDFDLPKNWKIKVIGWPRFWTQIGLSLEMLFHPIDALFIPAHTAPLIHPARSASLRKCIKPLLTALSFLHIVDSHNRHSDAGGPKNTIVVVHGLEYEVFPEGYSFWERLYMRLSIKFSCRAAKKIIAVSKNTKKDLVDLYKISEEKIEVVYEGVSEKFQISNNKFQIKNYKPQLLFIGRLEKRKNIEGIIEAFEILKERYKIPHKLVLAGKPGHGYEDTKHKVVNSKYKEDIIEAGYVSEEEKYNLLKNADIFLFPTFYEGFGLPILEAQSAGVPAVTSNISSMPEVGGDGAAYCDPNEPETIADAIWKILEDEEYRKNLIRKGYENTKKFSWEKCAREISKLLNG